MVMNQFFFDRFITDLKHCASFVPFYTVSRCGVRCTHDVSGIPIEFHLSLKLRASIAQCLPVYDRLLVLTSAYTNADTCSRAGWRSIELEKFAFVVYGYDSQSNS